MAESISLPISEVAAYAMASFSRKPRSHRIACLVGIGGRLQGWCGNLYGWIVHDAMLLSDVYSTADTML